MISTARSDNVYDFDDIHGLEAFDMIEDWGDSGSGIANSTVSSQGDDMSLPSSRIGLTPRDGCLHTFRCDNLSLQSTDEQDYNNNYANEVENKNRKRRGVRLNDADEDGATTTSSGSSSSSNGSWSSKSSTNGNVPTTRKRRLDATTLKHHNNAYKRTNNTEEHDSEAGDDDEHMFMITSISARSADGNKTTTTTNSTPSVVSISDRSDLSDEHRKLQTHMNTQLNAQLLRPPAGLSHDENSGMWSPMDNAIEPSLQQAKPSLPLLNFSTLGGSQGIGNNNDKKKMQGVQLKENMFDHHPPAQQMQQSSQNAAAAPEAQPHPSSNTHQTRASRRKAASDNGNVGNGSSSNSSNGRSNANAATTNKSRSQDVTPHLAPEPTQQPQPLSQPVKQQQPTQTHARNGRHKLPQHIHDRVVTYAPHILRTFNSGNAQELVAAVDRACSAKCIIRTRLVKSQQQINNTSSGGGDASDVPFADMNVSRDRIVDFFRGISEAFPDGIFQTHVTKVQVQPNKAIVVATKYSFSGTMIKSVYEDKVESQFDLVDPAVFQRLQNVRPQTQSVLATGTMLLTLGEDYKADSIDMNYISNVRIVNAALMG